MSFVASTVELFYSGVWNVMTADVLNREGGIRTTRGRRAEGSAADPAVMTLQLRGGRSQVNPAIVGRYSLQNPRSDLYGLIGRNTPIRVTVSGSVRFVGEVVRWPLRWDTSGNDVWVPAEAAGILRRLGGAGGSPKPAPSAMRRAILDTTPAPAAYWPLEDGPLAGQADNQAAPGNPMRPVGDIGWAGFVDDASGSAPLPNLRFTAGETVTELWGPVDGVFAEWTVGFSVAFDEGDPWNALTIYTRNTQFQEIRVGFQGASQVEIRGITEPGVATMLITSSQNLADGRLHWLELRTSRVGTTVTVVLHIDGVGINSGNFTQDDAGDPWKVRPAGNSSRSTAVVGHLGIWRSVSSIFGEVVSALRGHTGEPAGRRVERLCAENGVAFVGLGDLDATMRMGAQRPRPLLDLLRECEVADQGLLLETRTALGLTYRTNGNLLNQVAAVSLDYSAGHLSPPFHPDDDDQRLSNDVAVQRPGGSQARATLAAGPMSTADSPDGIGRLDSQTSALLESDLRLSDLASWLLHVGTWPGARYPLLRLDLRHMAEIVGSTVLRDAILAADAGSRIDVTGLPEWLAPEDALLLVNGYDELVTADQHEIAFNASPYGPHVAGIYATDAEVPGPAEPKRYSPFDSRANATFTVGTHTALSVADQTGGNDLWSTNADTPFDIRVRHPAVGGSGVRLRVTAVGAAVGAVQTLTVQQAPIHATTGVVVGIGWPVELWQPAVYSL